MPLLLLLENNTVLQGTRRFSQCDEARWDLRAGTLLGTLECHHDPVDGIVFSPGGSRRITASNAGTLHLWGTQSNMPVGLTLDSHVREVLTRRFSADSRYIASGSPNGVTPTLPLGRSPM